MPKNREKNEINAFAARGYDKRDIVIYWKRWNHLEFGVMLCVRVCCTHHFVCIYICTNAMARTLFIFMLYIELLKFCLFDWVSGSFCAVIIIVVVCVCFHTLWANTLTICVCLLAFVCYMVLHVKT